MSSVARLVQRFRGLLRSFTLRLTMLLAGIFAIGMALAIYLALGFGRDAVLERVDTSLMELAALVEADDEPESGSAAIIRPLSRLAGLPPAFAKAVRAGGGTIELDDDFRRSEQWRVLVARDSEGTPVLIALPLDDSDDALELLGRVLWTTAGIVIVLVLGIGVGAGLLAQRRLGRISETLDRLARGDLAARTGVMRSTDDLDDLARQLDRTGSDLERLVAQTRNLSASLAHDLRTPLARLRAKLEMLPEGDERGAALEEAERLSGIFDTILRVARIEAAQGQTGLEPVDLGGLINEMQEIFGPVVEDGGKRLLVAADNPRTIRADRAMLVQALANLIQNGIVHGGPEIVLFAERHAIGVSDNGAGVAPDLHDEILKPMVRLDAARETDGTGLGLALVRAVADRHGATLMLSQHQPTGLRVTLDFTDL